MVSDIIHSILRQCIITVFFAEAESSEYNYINSKENKIEQSYNEEYGHDYADDAYETSLESSEYEYQYDTEEEEENNYAEAEHGYDYQDDYEPTERPRRLTFYQSHIFPMHMLQSLKVGLHMYIVFFKLS